MGGYTPINKGLYSGFMAAPFIFELKVISDWTFTRTALDLFQWIKFENIYGNLFIAKIANKGYTEHPLGQKIPAFMKAILGFGLLVGVILIIAGPLLLFSTLNPLASDNPINGANIRLEIVTNLTMGDDKDNGPTNIYELFNSNKFQYIGPIPNTTYKLFSNYRSITNLDRKFFQQTIFQKVSDNNWDISPPSRQALYDKLMETQEKRGINLVLHYSFDRDQPPEMQNTEKALPKVDITAPGVDNQDFILDQLKEAVSKSLDLFSIFRA